MKKFSEHIVESRQSRRNAGGFLLFEQPATPKVPSEEEFKKALEALKDYPEEQRAGLEQQLRQSYEKMKTEAGGQPPATAGQPVSVPPGTPTIGAATPEQIQQGKEREAAMMASFTAPGNQARIMDMLEGKPGEPSALSINQLKRIKDQLSAAFSGQEVKNITPDFLRQSGIDVDAVWKNLDKQNYYKFASPEELKQDAAAGDRDAALAQGGMAAANVLFQAGMESLPALVGAGIGAAGKAGLVNVSPATAPLQIRQELPGGRSVPVSLGVSTPSSGGVRSARTVGQPSSTTVRPAPTPSEPSVTPRPTVGGVAGGRPGNISVGTGTPEPGKTIVRPSSGGISNILRGTALGAILAVQTAVAGGNPQFSAPQQGTSMVAPGESPPGTVAPSTTATARPAAPAAPSAPASVRAPAQTLPAEPAPAQTGIPSQANVPLAPSLTPPVSSANIRPTTPSSAPVVPSTPAPTSAPAAPSEGQREMSPAPKASVNIADFVPGIKIVQQAKDIIQQGIENAKKDATSQETPSKTEDKAKTEADAKAKAEDKIPQKADQWWKDQTTAQTPAETPAIVPAVVPAQIPAEEPAKVPSPAKEPAKTEPPEKIPQRRTPPPPAEPPVRIPETPPPFSPAPKKKESKKEEPSPSGGSGVGQMFISGLATTTKEAEPIIKSFKMRKESITPEILIQRARFSMINEVLFSLIERKEEEEDEYLPAEDEDSCGEGPMAGNAGMFVSAQEQPPQPEVPEMKFKKSRA